MTKIDLTMHPERLENSLKRVRERNIVIPTFEQMKNPELDPRQGQRGPALHRALGSESAQPFQDQLEE